MILSSRAYLLGALGLCLVWTSDAVAQQTNDMRPTHPAGDLSIILVVQGRPHGVAATADGKFCVSQVDANSVTCGRVSPDGVSIGPAVGVGQTPAHVALSVDGRWAYTADQYANTMSIVDVRKREATGTVRLSDGGFNLVAHPVAPRVYVTTAAGILHVIDTRSRGVLARIRVGEAANGLALDRRGGVLYVSSRDAGTITAINTVTNAISRTYEVDAMPQRIALSPDGRTLYVATESTGLDILDLESGEHDAVRGVRPGAVGLALSPDGAQLYVANPTAGIVQVVDAAARAVVETHRGLSRPRNATFTLAGGAALVTGEGNRVYVFR